MREYGVYWQDNSTILCVFGGTIIGAIAASRMAMFGKVTGISGFVSGLINLTTERTERVIRAAVVSGLVVGGVIANSFIPEAFEDWHDLPIARLVMGGILVGFGTVTSNGCTSGHGVCGIASLRIRSVVATGAFMLSAIVTAMSSNTQSFYPVFNNTLSLEVGGIVLVVVCGFCALIVSVAHQVTTSTSASNSEGGGSAAAGGGAVSTKTASRSPYQHIYASIADFLFGIAFSLGLSVSNMTKPSAVIAFLDLRYWNPALAFVMCSAIPVSAVSFYYILQRPAPLLDTKFYRPALDSIDTKLVMGAVIFGVGWGLTGACPGPAITNLGAAHIPPLIYCCCLVFGMLLSQLMDHVQKTRSASAPVSIKNSDDDARVLMVEGKA